MPHHGSERVALFKASRNKKQHHLLSNELFNEDIFRIILSYLQPKDLMNLHLVSQSLQICQMTTMDCWWKRFYQLKLSELGKKSKSKGFSIQWKISTMETVTQDFRQHLVEASKVYNMKRLKCKYYDKQEIMKFKLKDLIQVQTTESQLSTLKSVKLLVVGNGATGKTWLLMRMTQNSIPGLDGYTPTVMEQCSHNITVEGETYTIDLVDSTGSDEYGERLRPLSYVGSDIFIVTFSSIDKNSYEMVKSHWIPEVTHHCPNVPILLVATKKDLRENMNNERNGELKYPYWNPISFEKGQELAKQMGCISFMETSAQTGEGFMGLEEVIVKCVMLARCGKAHRFGVDDKSSKNKCSIQ
ncbi:hypothetical protein C9374_011773 [Naegleria lovaniensis]|uniref:Uncharacterized protein n=1 Tax=Naegleria lovaniensis TaxID=51637 RepID=A0AA88GFE7_NAELO|nr:uncharacterized protein C9374_011773 [Naegleria lovaniensis]KAG2373888.1 hypothetical protein C9374_011773 [Naegleria lovaniensis]